MATGASIGQVWTRHLAPTAPAVTAFIAISVLPAVHQTGCLSMRLFGNGGGGGGGGRMRRRGTPFCRHPQDLPYPHGGSTVGID